MSTVDVPTGIPDRCLARFARGHFFVVGLLVAGIGLGWRSPDGVVETSSLIVRSEGGRGEIRLTASPEGELRISMVREGKESAALSMSADGAAMFVLTHPGHPERHVRIEPGRGADGFPAVSLFDEGSGQPGLRMCLMRDGAALLLEREDARYSLMCGRGRSRWVLSGENGTCAVQTDSENGSSLALGFASGREQIRLSAFQTESAHIRILHRGEVQWEAR
ncbi:MAG: hypothetical protein HUU15_17965 [Candidatus Brocadiae bacterium]|nr:hypothetical protein [Candidatus Brocadiia bacterium]